MAKGYIDQHPAFDVSILGPELAPADLLIVGIDEHDIGTAYDAIRIGFEIGHLLCQAFGKRDVVGVHPCDELSGGLPEPAGERAGNTYVGLVA